MAGANNEYYNILTTKNSRSTVVTGYTVRSDSQEELGHDVCMPQPGDMNCLAGEHKATGTKLKRSI